MRKVKIIDKEQILRMPVRSVAELLQHILNVDIRQRGALGVQADVNMHGSNFEQILISVNGVRINDPQTGHYDMDLPVTMMDIERVEILPGAGSSLYGPGAFAGAINIVTKQPEAKAVELEAAGGSFDLSTQGLSISYPLGTINSRFSFTREESSGYRPDTDFTVSSLSFNAQKEFAWATLEYLFGYTKKDFGADSFYSNLYPHEEDHTDTRFFNLKAHIKNKIFEIESDFYYRRHSDKFILDRNRPQWYVNYHTTYSYGGDLQGLLECELGSFLVGGGVSQEKITSTNLGGHLRDSQALYAQFQSPLEKRILFNLGLRLDHYQTWGWQTSPSLSMAYKINRQLRLKTSGGRSFRIPSFTDLYYQSPANIGNQDLTPEKAWSYQTGLEFEQDVFCAELVYFRRWADDLIGWVRPASDVAWQAENIAQVDAQGWELDLSLKAPEHLCSIFSQVYAGYIYQYLGSESISLNTKYNLDFLKHHAHLGLLFSLPYGLTQNLMVSYKQRIEQRPYFLLDSRISKKINQERFDLEIFLDITNLLNTSYSEQSGVAMPGRWIVAGLRIKL